MLLLTRVEDGNEEILIGEPRINEPEKNEELKWIPINELPSNIVNDRYIAIENYKNGTKYSEFGW